MTADLAFEVDDAMSLSEPSLNVSESFVDDGDLGRMVGLEFAGSLVSRQYWGELFDSDANKLGSVFREIRVFGEHHRDRLPYVPEIVSRPNPRGKLVHPPNSFPPLTRPRTTAPQIRPAGEGETGRKAPPTQHKRPVLKP